MPPVSEICLVDTLFYNEGRFLLPTSRRFHAPLTPPSDRPALVKQANSLSTYRKKENANEP